jgi:alanine dehydrogenase
VVTCTPSTVPLLRDGDLTPGTFLAAVGADSPHKQELDPALLANSKVVVDILAQCEVAGELHHALGAGLMTKSQVHAQLGERSSRASNPAANRIKKPSSSILPVPRCKTLRHP